MIISHQMATNRERKNALLGWSGSINHYNPSNITTHGQWALNIRSLFECESQLIRSSGIFRLLAHVLFYLFSGHNDAGYIFKNEWTPYWRKHTGLNVSCFFSPLTIRNDRFMNVFRFMYMMSKIRSWMKRNWTMILKILIWKKRWVKREGLVSPIWVRTRVTLAIERWDMIKFII